MRRSGRSGATAYQLVVWSAAAALIVCLALAFTVVGPMKAKAAAGGAALPGWQVLVFRGADFLMGWWWLVVIVLGVALASGGRGGTTSSSGDGGGNGGD